jgi:hypothetical protein
LLQGNHQIYAVVTPRSPIEGTAKIVREPLLNKGRPLAVVAVFKVKAIVFEVLGPNAIVKRPSSVMLAEGIGQGIKNPKYGPLNEFKYEAKEEHYGNAPPPPKPLPPIPNHHTVGAVPAFVTILK